MQNFFTHRTCPEQGRRVMRISTFALALGLTLLWLLRTAPTQAAGMVTDCTSQQGLDNAMNSGSGLITFNCGGTNAPATILITQAGGLNVATFSSYTIDGGNVITLSGGNTNRLFTVFNGALTLTNILLTNGYAAAGGQYPTQGGAILNNGGRLVLDHATVRNSRSTYAGGAIEDVGRTTLLSDSLIENNQSDYGGGIDSIGTLTLINTTVRSNQALTHTGGGLDVGGTVTISNSQIYSNTGYAGGGGLNITGPGSVAIGGSQIYSNRAPTNTNTNGGAIWNQGTLIITQSALNDNSASFGGGISNLGSNARVALTNSTVSGNRASSRSGGGIYNNGTLILNNSTLSGNSADGVGGGLFNGGEAVLTNITLSGNAAAESGGLYNASLATLTLINSTLSGNSARDFGGGLINNYHATLMNVTLSGNAATTGGALYTSDGATTVLTNTILAYSPTGGNCVGSIAASKFTFSSDNTCALPAANTIKGMNPNGLDPLLMALGNYGGPTQVHMLKLGSPAIDGVVGSDAPSTDQRGLPRPQGGGYDIGAVERQPSDVDIIPKLWLPLIVR